MDISIAGLKKLYGSKLVLDIDRLHLERGELVGVIGNNGAGKTTLFRLTLDLIRASEGQVSIDGMDVAQSEQWKHACGSFLDEGFLIDFLSPEEYFGFVAQLHHIGKQQLEEQLERFRRFTNDEILGQQKLIREFSTGNKQKIGIMAAMLSHPKLIILDEPFNFLDPTSQILIKRILKQENQHRHTTMLISSHNLNHIIEICTRIILLENGRIIKDIKLPSDELRSVEAYFAVEDE